MEDKNKSINDRPYVYDTPGMPAHPMTDEQYADYLRMREELAMNPPPAPEPSMADILAEVKALRTENAQLQQQVDALTEGRTGNGR